ncbi:hypothetical protein F2Q68_00027298 [Brassica cretica]|uniref:Uncharacterized protein n=2 Tax=Brassica cretica TaxID=69181 RepID=A0A8S9IEH3_BRACR|nr:hypothetical protein F2Q68_00027298 [Brassica cretica]
MIFFLEGHMELSSLSSRVLRHKGRREAVNGDSHQLVRCFGYSEEEEEEVRWRYVLQESESEEDVLDEGDDDEDDLEEEPETQVHPEAEPELHSNKLPATEAFEKKKNKSR